MTVFLWVFRVIALLLMMETGEAACRNNGIGSAIACAISGLLALLSFLVPGMVST